MWCAERVKGQMTRPCAAKERTDTGKLAYENEQGSTRVCTFLLDQVCLPSPRHAASLLGSLLLLALEKAKVLVDMSQQLRPKFCRSKTAAAAVAELISSSVSHGLTDLSALH